MTLIPFAPKPGMRTDETLFADEASWQTAEGCRFYMGKPQVLGSRIKLADLTILFGGGSTIKALFAHEGAAGTYLVVGTQANLFSATVPASIASIRTTGGAVTGWSFGSFGTTLLACETGVTIYQSTGASAATEVTQAPNAITQMLTTPERQVLALGCNEEVSGTFNGRCIRGCDLEDFTDWTTTASNNAFEHILDGPGTIVGARMIGPYVAVWTTTSLHLGQFIGDPGQTYRFDRVSDGCGLLNQNAVTVTGGVAYWMGTDLYPRRWAPGGMPEVIPCPVSQKFIPQMTTQARRDAVRAATATAFGEVWFIFDSVSSRGALIYSTADGVWTAHVGSSPEFLCEDDKFATITAGVNQGYRTTVVGVFAVDEIWATELQPSTVVSGATDPTFNLRTTDYYIDSSQRRMLIRGFIPDFDSQTADINLAVLCRSTPQGSNSSMTPLAITTATTKKDFRRSGKIITVNLTGTGYFRLGKPLFDAVTMGER